MAPCCGLPGLSGAYLSFPEHPPAAVDGRAGEQARSLAQLRAIKEPEPREDMHPASLAGRECDFRTLLAALQSAPPEPRQLRDLCPQLVRLGAVPLGLILVRHLGLGEAVLRVLIWS